MKCHWILAFLILVLTLRISVVSIGSRQSRANFLEREACTCKKSRTGNCNVPLVIGFGPQLSSLPLYVFSSSFLFSNSNHSQQLSICHFRQIIAEGHRSSSARKVWSSSSSNNRHPGLQVNLFYSPFCSKKCGNWSELPMFCSLGSLLRLGMWVESPRQRT